MDTESRQLRRNRAKVAIIVFGLMVLGTNDLNVGRWIGHHGDHGRPVRSDDFEIHIDRVEAAAERAAELAERAARLAELAAQEAERKAAAN